MVVSLSNFGIAVFKEHLIFRASPAERFLPTSHFPGSTDLQVFVDSNPEPGMTLEQVLHVHGALHFQAINFTLQHSIVYILWMCNTLHKVQGPNNDSAQLGQTTHVSNHLFKCSPTPTVEMITPSSPSTHTHTHTHTLTHIHTLFHNIHMLTHTHCDIMYTQTHTHTHTHTHCTITYKHTHTYTYLKISDNSHILHHINIQFLGLKQTNLYLILLLTYIST